jgi:hypothetical protein
MHVTGSTYPPFHGFQTGDFLNASSTEIHWLNSEKINKLSINKIYFMKVYLNF